MKQIISNDCILDTGPISYVSERLVFVDGSRRVVVEGVGLESSATLPSLAAQRVMVMIPPYSYG